MADDGRGTIIPGEAAGQSEVFGVWGGNGFGNTGSTPTDTAREGSRREAALEYHTSWRRGMNPQDGFLNRRGTKELSC